jgi:hypothetical protein
MPKGSQARPTGFDDGEKPGGWPFAVSFESVSSERAAGWFLGEDGTLNLLWTEGTGPATRKAELRWQVLEEGSELPAAGAGDSLTPQMVSRALVGLLD